MGRKRDEGPAEGVKWRGESSKRWIMAFHTRY